MSESKRPTPADGKTERQGHGGWWFLLGVVLLYGLLALIAPGFAGRSLRHFLAMGRDLLPVLLLVFLFIWLFNLSSGVRKKLVRLSDRESGPKGWLLAVTGGVLSHGPIYPWYPLLRELKAHGVRPALLAAFLYARSVKLPWLPLMAHYFGLRYMLILTGYMVLFSVLNGWLLERLLGKNDD
ncbi:MAG TPA: permease [Sedimenticola sp.]|nr:permease [Sedimenticola sp.]